MVKLIKTKSKKTLFSRLINTISLSGKKSSDNPDKQNFPLLDNSMITPTDAPLKTNSAVNIYKQHMLAIGYLEKNELDDFVNSLREDIKEHELQLKNEASWAKESLAEIKAAARKELKRLNKLLSKCDEKEERQELRSELECTEAGIHVAVEDFNNASGELAEFKKDKRDFLINYINSEIFGSDWSTK